MGLSRNRILFFGGLSLVAVFSVWSSITTKQPEPAPTPVTPEAPSASKPKFDFTAAEFTDFQGAITEIDPNKAIIQAMSHEGDEQFVTVVVSDTFALQPKLKKGEAMKSIRDLAKIACECRPTLAFYTVGKTKVGQISVSEPQVNDLAGN